MSKADAQSGEAEQAAEAAPAALAEDQGPIARRLRKRSRPAATAAAPAKRQRSAQLPDPERVGVGSRVTCDFDADWCPGTVIRVVAGRAAGHRKVKVDFDDGDELFVVLRPGSWEFE